MLSHLLNTGLRMEIKPQEYCLFINGRNHLSRGLDLAFNPYNGRILGKVLLVSQSLLEEEKAKVRAKLSEDTVRIKMDAVDPQA